MWQAIPAARGCARPWPSMKIKSGSWWSLPKAWTSAGVSRNDKRPGMYGKVTFALWTTVSITSSFGNESTTTQACAISSTKATSAPAIRLGVPTLPCGITLERSCCWIWIASLGVTSQEWKCWTCTARVLLLLEQSFDAFYGLSCLAAEALGRFPSCLGGLLQEFAGACDRLHNRLVNRHQHFRRGLLHHHPA